MLNRLILTLVTGFFAPAIAFAIPLPKGPKALMSLPNTFTTDYDFEGIVGLSNCSGSLIQLEGAPDTDPALVLTNGHCYERGMPRPGQVIYGRPSSRRFDLLDANGGSVGRLQASSLLYATMTKTDISLYQLTLTYADIKRLYNVRPLTLSSQHPAIGTPIEVISGYWLRGYTCGVEFFVHELVEEGYSMSDSIRYTRPGCEVIGGTSGSPVIATGTRTVVGINNTGNEDGQRCTLNNPCEIDEHGNVKYIRGYSYGQQTYWIYTCLNESRQIDLARPGCLLPH